MIQSDLKRTAVLRGALGHEESRPDLHSLGARRESDSTTRSIFKKLPSTSSMRKQIPILRGLAILAVVMSHCAAWGHHVMFYWAHRYRQVESPNFDQFGSFSYYVLLAINGLPMFAVPAFLFISGYYIAYAIGGRPITAGSRVVWARIKVLLWPYLIWSFAIFLGDFLQGQTYPIPEYARRLIRGHAVGAYFFIPVLIQFYILSPLIVRYAESKPRLLLLVSAIVQGAMYYLCGSRFGRFFRPLDAASLALYFPLGTVCFLHHRRASEWLARFKSSMLLATVVLSALMVFEKSVRLESLMLAGVERQSDELSPYFYSLTFILFFVAADSSRLPFARTLRWLGTRSYGIYLLHFSVLVLVARVTAKYAPRLLAHQILFQPLLLLTGLGLPLLFMACVARSPIRELYRYLFGVALQLPLRRKTSPEEPREVPVSEKSSDADLQHWHAPTSGVRGGN